MCNVTKIIIKKEKERERKVERKMERRGGRLINELNLRTASFLLDSLSKAKVNSRVNSRGKGADAGQ